MSWTSILSDQPISYAYNRPSCFRSSLREQEIVGGTAVGIPVYFNPVSTPIGVNGYPGPKYQYHKNYNNSTSSILGNCTWWCWGRLKDALGTELPNLGNGVNWYANYTGSKETNANNIQPGDIISFSSSSPEGHVMFVESVVGSTVYISQSAYSSRSLWSGYACRVTSYDKSEIYAGHSIDMYKDISDSGFSVTTIGILHTGGGVAPDPPGPPEPPAQLDPAVISVVGKIVKNREGVDINVKLYKQ